MPYEAWICAAGEASKHASSGVQVLLCWTCTALFAWVLPCAHHQRHCWLPLPACWWVCKKNYVFIWFKSCKLWQSTEKLFFLPSHVQILSWMAVKLWVTCSLRVWTWWKLQWVTLAAAALLSVLNSIDFHQSHTLRECFEGYFKQTASPD